MSPSNPRAGKPSVGLLDDELTAMAWVWGYRPGGIVYCLEAVYAEKSSVAVGGRFPYVLVLLDKRHDFTK